MIQRLKKVPGPVRAMALVEAVLKLVATRKAIQNRQFGWAAAILVVNSAGILPLVYLLRYQRPRSSANV
jgi:Family of unknown function (DUF5652)